MKFTTKTKLYIYATLDSSETIMFNQGGMHKITLNPNVFDKELDEIEIQFQIERSSMSRHEFIIKSAADHLHLFTDEEIEARKKD